MTIETAQRMANHLNASMRTYALASIVQHGARYGVRGYLEVVMADRYRVGSVIIIPVVDPRRAWKVVHRLARTARKRQAQNIAHLLNPIEEIPF